MYHDIMCIYDIFLALPAEISFPIVIILKQLLGEESEHLNSSVGFTTSHFLTLNASHLSSQGMASLWTAWTVKKN